MAQPPRLINPRLNVLLDDGTYIEDVKTITADYMRWEKARESLRLPTREQDPLPWITYLAWHALRRTGQIEELTFADFIGGQDFKPGRCHEVNQADGSDAVDPTKLAVESAS